MKNRIRRVLYANIKSSTPYELRHLDCDSVLSSPEAREAEIFSMPEITNMPATRRVHSFSVNEQSYRLDISETWRAHS